MNETLQQKAAAAARRMVGTPFRHQGKLPGVGVDCAGLCIAAYREAGLDVPNVGPYPRDPDPALLLRWLEALADRVDDPAEGDLVRFELGTKLGGARHLGLIVADGRFASVMRDHRVEIDGLDGRWRDRVLDYWRVR